MRSEKIILPEELSEQEETSSDQEVFFNPQPSTSKEAQVRPSMYMPYIEGPTMDWTLNDRLYNRFLKCRLKCKNILECELAVLPEERKGKKIVAWSGDFSLDQHISWNLSLEDLTLEVILKKFEEFCKLQANELRERFDLLTSFRQADVSVNEWYNEWHVELSKAPASTVHQPTKKMESSQATAKHMNQVARDPQAVQVNLLRHQCTELPPSKFQRKQKKSFKARQTTNKSYQEDTNRERMTQAQGRFHKNQQAHASHEKYSSEDRCSKCGDTLHVEGFRCPGS